MMEENEEEEGSLAALARERAEGEQSSVAQHRKLPAADRPRGVPRWYRTVTPMLFILGGVLMVIGLWAAGAMIYMKDVTPMGPEDVKYPLLRWSDDVGTSGGYAPESRTMAMAMLLCIPLAVVMAVMVMILRRQVRALKSHEVE